MGNFKLNKSLILTMLFLVVISFVECSPKLYKTGKDFAASGNYQAAIEQYTKLLDENPEFTEAYIARAEAHKNMEQFREAAEDYKRATALDKENEEVFFNAGRLYYQLKDYDEALPMLTKAVALEKKNMEAQKLTYQSYIATEQYDQALRYANNAVGLDKEDASNFFWRGYIYRNLENYTQSESDLRQSLKLNPQEIKTYAELAEVLYEAEKYNQALNISNQALGLDPKNERALWVRSKVYHKNLEYANAINDLSKLIIFDNENEEAFFTRGIYYQEFNQHQGAINDFSKVLALNPDHPQAHYLRGLSYEEVTNYPKAIEDYEKYAQIMKNDEEAAARLKDVKKRLYELNRETEEPVLKIEKPYANNTQIHIVDGSKEVTIKGIIEDSSPIEYARFNGNEATITEDENGRNFEVSFELPENAKNIEVAVADVYNNVLAENLAITYTEVDAPEVKLIAPYASSTGEVYLENDSRKLYVEGEIVDESYIKSIFVEDMTASFQVETENPEFFATIDITNKNSFKVKVEDIYGNVTENEYIINREGVDLSQDNPMGKTWVIFIENSNYETFASLDGPVKDVSMMKAALANYKIHNIIHKEDMTKEDLERFFSIELRDLVRANHVNSLLIWYAGHGKFINETGYWVPIDAQRDDEFTYFNINNLKAALQGYADYVTHTLVITDACESGPTFYQAMRSVPKERDCSDWQATRFKSSQVFSSAGYELAVDNSQFTRTFANSLMNNPNACLPIENIVSKVTIAVAKSGMQKPQFGKIAGLEDEGGTFFFISK